MDSETYRPGLISHLDKKYVESGIWKCSDSPTGAHHWVYTSDSWVCRYCKGVKRTFDSRDRSQKQREQVNNIKERGNGSDNQV